MRRLIALLALLVALPAAATTYRVSFVAMLSDEMRTPRDLIVYCPADTTGSLWFVERQADPKTGGWVWTWETDEISPRMAKERFVVYGDDGLGNVTAAAFTPSQGATVTLSWGKLPPPRVEAEGIYFDPPAGLDASLLDHLEAVRNGQGVKAKPGQADLRLDLCDGCQLSTRAVLAGGKHFLQSVAIQIEHTTKATT